MLDPKFVEFLQKSETALAHLVAVAKEWAEMQTKAPELPGGAEGPREWKEGEEVAQTVVPLSAADLDSLNKQMATAMVKEKAIEFAKGFIAGVSVAI